MKIWFRDKTLLKLIMHRDHDFAKANKLYLLNKNIEFAKAGHTFSFFVILHNGILHYIVLLPLLCKKTNRLDYL